MAVGLLPPGGAVSLLVGAITAAVGLGLYLSCRSQAPAVLVLLGAPAATDVAPACRMLPIVGWMPSFLHAMALTLATGAFLPPTRRATIGAGAAWFLVNVAWEAACALADGGAPTAWRELLKAMPGVAAGVGDPLDVLAAGLGALVALVGHDRWMRAKRQVPHPGRP